MFLNLSIFVVVEMNSKEMAQDSIFYSYTKNINGFAAHLEEGVANQIASREKYQLKLIPSPD
jgi:hypothetical protein